MEGCSPQDALRFYKALQARLDKFNLQLVLNKNRIIEFGRFAARDRDNRGEGKPEIFSFLGFTHYCSKNRKGKFRLKWKTDVKKFRAKVKAFKVWIKAVRNINLMSELFREVKPKLLGHYAYYGINDNSVMIRNYYDIVVKLLFKWLNRRSQRKSFSFTTFKLYLRLNPLPLPRIYVNLFG